MSYAIACARATVFRAVAVYSGGAAQRVQRRHPADRLHRHPRHLRDNVLNISQGRSLRDTFVRNNGCTPQNPPEPAPGQPDAHHHHLLGCRAGYPVVWAAFDGGHSPGPVDGCSGCDDRRPDLDQGRGRGGSTSSRSSSPADHAAAELAAADAARRPAQSNVTIVGGQSGPVRRRARRHARPTAPRCSCGTATAAPTSAGPTPPSRQLTVYGNKCLDANGRGTSNGTAVDHLGLQRPDQPAVEPQRQRHHHRRAVRAVPGRQRRRHRQRHEDPAVVLHTAAPTSSGACATDRMTGSAGTGPRPPCAGAPPAFTRRTDWPAIPPWGTEKGPRREVSVLHRWKVARSTRGVRRCRAAAGRRRPGARRGRHPGDVLRRPRRQRRQPGTIAAPFKTVQRARDVVRTVNANMTGDIYVYLRGGNYQVTSTIEFDAERLGHQRVPGRLRRVPERDAGARAAASR